MTPVPTNKKAPRIPVEPLSERRWNAVRERVLVDAPLARTEGRLESQERAPAQRGPWMVAALAVAAAALVMVRAVPSAAPSGLGSERVVTGDEPSYATAGDVRIDVGAHASVHAIEIEPDRWVVSVEHGEAHFEVPPRLGRPDFVVDAGQTHVVVIGTGFTVAREGGAPTGSVHVEHGRVRVSERGVEHVLGDGERWPALAAVAPAAVAPADPGSHAHAVDVAEVAAPAEPIVAASEPAERPLHGSAAAHVATTASAAERSTTEATEPSASAPAPSEVAAPPPPAIPSDAAARFAEAQRLERTDPTRALALYAGLADEGGPWGANALYAGGRLEADLHHGARAQALLQRYLARHPEGPNAEDATDLLRSLP